MKKWHLLSSPLEPSSIILPLVMGYLVPLALAYLQLFLTPAQLGVGQVRAIESKLQQCIGIGRLGELKEEQESKSQRFLLMKK